MGAERDEDSQDAETAVAPDADTGASGRMRAAREAAGLSLGDVAQRTRVPLRHLEALESGRYHDLPGVTYCAGFARAYARAVGMDEAALVAQIRDEIDARGDIGKERYEFEEPVGSNSVPPRTLVWVTAALALLIAGGYAIWRMQLNTPPATEAMTNTAAGEARITTPDAPRKSSRAAAAAGPVVLTAVDDVWLRIYDEDGKRLFEKAMPKGESYTVPADARNPMILTGRADALSVTVGGQAVPPLGTAERTIADVPISAAALLARGKAPPAGEGAPAAPVNAAAPGNAAR